MGQGQARDEIDLGRLQKRQDEALGLTSRALISGFQEAVQFLSDVGIALRYGLPAYMRVRPLSLEEQRLVGLLDRTGTIVGLSNWLRWLCYERRPFEDYALVAQRMRRLIERMERWPANFLF